MLFSYTQKSYENAMLTVGGLIDLVDEVATGKVRKKNVYAKVLSVLTWFINGCVYPFFVLYSVHYINSYCTKIYADYQKKKISNTEIC